MDDERPIAPGKSYQATSRVVDIYEHRSRTLVNSEVVLWSPDGDAMAVGRPELPAESVVRQGRAARFPTVKSLDTFDFLAIPSVNKQLVTRLAVCEYIDRRENVIAMGNSGTGKTHMALGLGLAACQRGLSVGFTTAAVLVNELMEARDERRLLNFQKRLSRLKLLIIDELGFVPLSKTGAELLFEVFSQRYERGSVLVTTNLPFDEWTEVFGSERLTGALLDRLTQHVLIIEMNGESYRLKESRQTTAMLSSD